MAAQRAPVADDAQDLETSTAVVQVVLDVLAGYELREEDAIDATRALRSALHGFITLEADGGFGLPQDIDRSFERLVRVIATGIADWPAVAEGPSARGA
jgi:hypothetical protein